MITTLPTYQDAHRDFKELLDKNEAERKATIGTLHRSTFIGGVIVPENTMDDFFKEIYDKGALLVISTCGIGAHVLIATLKRHMQHEKYADYRLKINSDYTISVWGR